MLLTFSLPRRVSAFTDWEDSVRVQTQLEQMQAMGFSDASRNVRALLAAGTLSRLPNHLDSSVLTMFSSIGGNVEAAISYLFDNQ